MRRRRRALYRGLPRLARRYPALARRRTAARLWAAPAGERGALADALAREYRKTRDDRLFCLLAVLLREELLLLAKRYEGRPPYVAGDELLSFLALAVLDRETPVAGGDLVPATETNLRHFREKEARHHDKIRDYLEELRHRDPAAAPAPVDPILAGGIDRAISALKPEYQRALAARAEGVTAPELAADEGCSERAAEKRMERAQAALGRALERELGPGWRALFPALGKK